MTLKELQDALGPEGLADHFAVKCSGCKSTVMQCRCMSAGKTIYYVTECNVCPPPEPSGKSCGPACRKPGCDGTDNTHCDAVQMP